MSPKSPASDPSRRDFLTASAATALGLPALASRAGAAAPSAAPARSTPLGNRTIRVGLVGCGGRGTGAAQQALSTQGEVRLVAMGDAFADHLNSSLDNLSKAHPEKVDVPEESRFVGFDAYKKVIDSDIDLLVTATPPHFRPEVFEYAVQKGKHVFMEKPVAVDGWGVRKVLAAAELSRQKGLSAIVGLQRHHDVAYRELMRRVHDGAIGEIVAARCYWNMGYLWHKAREPHWSDLEWQMRNWLYFTWLSGDHIVEQHVHNLDVVNWAKQAYPVRAHGMGGRQVRVEPQWGHIFDHHAVEYEYADGSRMFSQCRQIAGCRNQVSEHLIGTKGNADSSPMQITGSDPWRFPRREGNNPYQTEHDELFAAIREGNIIHTADNGALSTLTAIMGRMATYTGQEITVEQALASERLGPGEYEFGDYPVPPVPMPGRS